MSRSEILKGILVIALSYYFISFLGVQYGSRMNLIISIRLEFFTLGLRRKEKIKEEGIRATSSRSIKKVGVFTKDLIRSSM